MYSGGVSGIPLVHTGKAFSNENLYVCIVRDIGKRLVQFLEGTIE